MRAWKPFLAFGATAAVVLVSVLAFAREPSAVEASFVAASVPAERLLIDDRDLPRPSSISDSVAVLQEDVTGDHRLSHFGAREEVIRSWGRTREGDSALIERILTYETPEEAQAEFDAAPQGRQFNDSDFGAIKREDISDLRLGAPAAAVSCIGAWRVPADTCRRWVFRGRYSQFVVELTLNDYIDDGKSVDVPRGIFWKSPAPWTRTLSMF
ncbi:hypothetical protein [Microtetraspora malaysiensis]|uniref:hypothetical protein n=1 Tax=Microtetraspora malaysiensis TaxID=161358 RepID=UPI0008319924|nr:hypothetical protein [Microtetraspora malaysiensis]